MSWNISPDILLPEAVHLKQATWEETWYSNETLNVIPDLDVYDHIEMIGDTIWVS